MILPGLAGRNEKGAHSESRPEGRDRLRRGSTPPQARKERSEVKSEALTAGRAKPDKRPKPGGLSAEGRAKWRHTQARARISPCVRAPGHTRSRPGDTCGRTDMCPGFAQDLPPATPGLPTGASHEPACQCGRHCGFSPWVGKIPCRRAWQHTWAFSPGQSPWTEEPGGLQSVGS